MPAAPALLFFAPIFFILGAALASFAGLVAARLHTGQGILRGRSRCDACGRPLPFAALVPVLSFAAAGGRAACCGARLSSLSPLAEGLLGALFVASYALLGASVVLPAFLAALALLTLLVMYDLAHEILPPALLVCFVAAAALAGYLAAEDDRAFLASLALAAIFALFFAALHVFSRGRAMGLADSPLVFGLALLVGPSAVPGLLFSFWIGAGVGILLLVAARPGARMGIEVPFAPFLAAGFLLAYFTQWDPFSITALLGTLFIGA